MLSLRLLIEHWIRLTYWIDATVHATQLPTFECSQNYQRQQSNIWTGSGFYWYSAWRATLNKVSWNNSTKKSEMECPHSINNIINIISNVGMWCWNLHISYLTEGLKQSIYRSYIELRIQYLTFIWAWYSTLNIKRAAKT